ncbi:MAG: signal peptidase I [Clostridiales bacterium]|nr:signal peptidase I [Clostridiales bacterium]
MTSKDRAIVAGEASAPASDAGNKSKNSWVSELVFYLILALAVTAVFLYTRSGNEQYSLFGYSVLTVLTDSMYPDYPVDTLIVIREVDPELIKPGDDITFLRSDNTTITHRVTKAHENYEDSGMRAFTTQGVANSFTDREKVYADNVLGLVVYHNFLIGAVIAYIKSNYILAAFMVLVVIGFTIAVRALLSGSKNTRA